MKLGVKFCGVMSETDIRKADRAGAGAVGVIARPYDMPRSIPNSHTVDLDRAAALSEATPLDLEFVLVARTGGYRDITRMADEVGADRIQIGHVEDPALMAALRDRYQGEIELTQVLHVDSGTRATDADPFIGEADYIQLDSPGPQPGGNAVVHDWQKSRAVAERVHEQGGLVILSGGLTVANVAEGIEAVRPDGVESEHANRKFDVYNEKMMREFVDEAV